MYKIRVLCSDAFTEELLIAFSELQGLDWIVRQNPGEPEKRVELLVGVTELEEMKIRLSEFLRQNLPQERIPSFVVRLVRQDWDQAWKRFFKGRRVASKFWVAPPWEGQRDDHEGLIELIIDAGTAFGTGQHPTTEMVLSLIEEFELKDKRVLDAGTGSGVLAIAASRLGANRITAFDIDRDSILQAQKNAALNQVERTIEFFIASIETLNQPGPWDLIMANMLPAQFASLAYQARDLLSPGGRIVFSGILAEAWEETRDFLLDELGLEFTQGESLLRKDGWVACLLQAI